MPYDCFISYASADIRLAEELHERLLAEGLKVWFDRVRLHAGYDWHREIEDGCENSRVFLPVLTPRWKQSEWTKFETYGAEAVIPLVYEGSWEDVCTSPLERFQAERLDHAHLSAVGWDSLFAALHRALGQPGPLKQRHIAHLPSLANPFFTGRERDLVALHEELHTRPRACLSQGRVRAITANGGYGKTTLVRHYAEKYWRCYPQMFWVDARLGFEAEFARLHDLLFPSESAAGYRDNDKALRALHALEGRETRFLVIDNAIDEQSALRWVPKSGGCYTLITTCFAGWSPAIIDPNDTINLNNYAGLCLVMGDLPEAEARLNACWRVSSRRLDRMAARTLFFRTALAALRQEPTALFIGQVKTITKAGFSPAPSENALVMEHLQQHLPAAIFSLLDALYAAINEPDGVRKLAARPDWQVIAPIPLERPWPKSMGD